MTPMRVRAYMAEPVISLRGALHFDGILATAVFRAMSRQEQNALPPINSRWAEDMLLPLATWSLRCRIPRGTHPNLYMPDPSSPAHGYVWGWKASAACRQVLCEGVREVRKKPPVDAMVQWGRDKRVDMACGQLKAQDKAYPQQWSDVVTWYAVGDIEQVRALLRRVDGIGKLCAMGAGWLLRGRDGPKWAVEPWPHDWSMWADIGATRILMRNLPVESAPDMPALTHDSIRAPYHHPSRRFPCRRADCARLDRAEWTG